MSSPIKQLLSTIESVPQVQAVCEAYRSGKNVSVRGVAGSAHSMLISLLYKSKPKPLLVVLPAADQAEPMRDELTELMGEGVASYFPELKISPWGHQDNSSLSQQLEVIQHLLEFGRNSQKTAQERESPATPVILTTAKAVIAELIDPEYFATRRIDLHEDEEIPFESLIEQLAEMGFARQPITEEPGDMSIRGGIVDMYPFSRMTPIRLEFWGDRIESIREFDPVTQRSESRLKRVILLPQEISSDAVNGTSKGKTSTLLDYLPNDTAVFFISPKKIVRQISEESGTAASDDDEWLNDEPGEFATDDWEDFLSRFVRFQRLILSQRHEGSHADNFDLGAIPQPGFRGDIKLLRHELETFNLKQSTATEQQTDVFELSGNTNRRFFVCESPTHAQRISEIFDETGISGFNIQVFTAAINHGFKIPALGLLVYTDHEFYGRGRRLRINRRHRQGLTFRQLKSLSMGDYIVHVDHGIGIYQGLERLSIGRHERECIVVHYLDNDKLFVPLEMMDRIQKYTAKEAVAPRVHKLGSLDWERLKKRSKQRVKDIAQDLIKLYAKRKAEQGFAFSQDTYWQKELEASFEFEDTPDQASAVQDVKSDMESDRPMDRLICGDVGFGKTEVAIRAAFKAVQDGKQTAVLVPTTLLAQQHFNTFTARLERFPIRIEMLSRFRTPAEQKQVAARLKTGEVDIVIGTHRLLSKDVTFKELGLIVVDEEQRFGVRHKERLKELKINADVMTLSATPIPRTLHMSLMSVRDMSMIHTAPRDRLPIHTEVVQYDRNMVRQAILREVHRGGQVFFVHNRVHSIHRIAALLRKLVPEVEIGVAHGQMKESELEKRVLAFVNGKFNVLVATMIIESGLDMPNVNTMIINRSDRFGLAQLYQLRGRVGRSNQKAYCYLLIPPVPNLSNEAIKRLETIEEFTDLGSGFQIALRDLEIRGAGNLLGAEQSGMIDAIGFDMYTRILDEAIQEARFEMAPEEAGAKPTIVECKVDLDGDAYLPDSYVDVPEERVTIYRRLAEAKRPADIEFVKEELQDRFGRLPEAATNLLGMVSLKLLGRDLGLRKLKVTPQECQALFAPETTKPAGEPFRQWLGSLVQRAPYPIEFFQNGGLGFRMPAPAGEPVLASTIKLLSSLNEVSTS